MKRIRRFMRTVRESGEAGLLLVAVLLVAFDLALIIILGR